MHDQKMYSSIIKKKEGFFFSIRQEWLILGLSLLIKSVIGASFNNFGQLEVRKPSTTGFTIPRKYELLEKICLMLRRL